MTAPDPTGWLHASAVVAPSPIAGRGLFATADLGVGTEVVRGRLVADSGAPNHVVNHSCDPNLGWSGAGTLITVRSVAAGDELTCDYSTATADPAFLLRCHCETYRCRQMVTGDDWQIAELQRRYAGRWAPSLQSLIDAL